MTPLFLKNVEKVSVKDNHALNGTTVDLVNAVGVTEVINDGSVGAVVLDNIGTAAVTVKGVATDATTTFSRGTSPVTAALTINVEDHGKLAAVGSAAVTGGAINSSDDDNDATSVTINAKGAVRIDTMNVTGTAVTATHTATSVTLNAAGETTFVGATGITGFDTTKAGTLTVTGAGKVDLSGLAGAIKTVDASASTGNVSFTASTYTGTAAGVSNGLTVTTGSGADAVTLSGVATASANTGAGNDTVTVVGGTLTAGAVLNGGDGTDTLVLSSADAVAAGANTTAGAALRATYSNFETLGISNELGATLEAGRLGFANSVRFDTALTSAGREINGLADGATLTFRAAADNSQVYTATVTGAATSTTDTLNLNLAADLAQSDNFDVRVAINGINNIVVNANDRVDNVVDNNALVGASDNGPDEGYTLFLTNAASLNTVTVKGGSQFIYAADASSTALKTIDATASTGNNTLDVSAFVGLERVTVKAGNGTNIINGSNTAFGDAIIGGTGRDTIDAGVGSDVLTGNGGRDTYLVNTVLGTSDSAATTTGFDKISDFGVVTAAITAATNNTLVVGTFAAETTNPGGANVDVINLTVADTVAVTVPTLGGLAADVNVNNVALQGAAGTDIVAGDLITANETAKGVLTIGGAAAAKVDTLAEWIAIADTMAAAQGDVVAFVFNGNSYLFQQGGVAAGAQVGADDLLIELTGVTGLGGTVGITVVGTNTAAAVGDILVG